MKQLVPGPDGFYAFGLHEETWSQRCRAQSVHGCGQTSNRWLWKQAMLFMK
jgi:hypothetical protein